MFAFILRSTRSPGLHRLFAAGFLSAPGAFGQEPEISPDELPRFPPLSPQAASQSFQIKDGFKIELAASEPLTTDPIAISFDARGRLFTCEMRGYSERRDERLGRVRMLTDDNRDGVFDRATTYADGLAWPTALICWDDGIFVGATPDIWWFRDTDGDGVADEKNLVFTGFGSDADRLNVQGLMNSFAWGPDCRIHGTTSHHGGVITRPDDSSFQAVRLRGSNFSFDPVKRELRRETGGAQYGLTFDDEGVPYVCSNSSHIEAVYYTWPWIDLDLPDPRVSIPIDGPAAEVYRTSPVEPWRVVRTRWRVQGKVGGPIEGGGRDSGYFTSASGLGIYRGDAFPPAFRGNAFVGDVGSNLVHRKLIEKQTEQVGMTARRPDDEQRIEFLTSTDTWFRPVMCQNGPDGALYVVDMYRETIEHPWSLPESIKAHLDLNSGNDRGRIWRITPEQVRYPGTTNMEHLSANKLVDMLKKENGWTRDMAMQLLYQRKAVDALRQAAKERGSAARPAVLHALAASGHLEPALVEEALEDPNPTVRRHALRLAARLPVTPALIAGLASDSDAWVRFEAALLLSEVETYPPEAVGVETLVQLAEHSPGDNWIQAALAEAASRRGEIGVLFNRVWDPATPTRLCEELAARADTGEMRTICESLHSAKNLDDAAAVMKALRRRPEAAWLKPLIERARALDSEGAVWIAGLDPEIPTETFWNLAEEQPALSLAAMEAAARDADWKKEGLARWSRLSAQARARVLEKLTAAEVLDALERGDLQVAEIPIPLRASLRNHGDAASQARAGRLLGGADTRSHREIAEHFRPALDLKGNPTNGEVLFTARCHLCHEKPGSTETNAGPELASFVNKGDAALLENIISPNKEVAPQYLSWRVVTAEGAVHEGLLGRETGSSVTLQLPGRQMLVLPRDRIVSMTNLNVSLMPPGLEAGLTLQEMADLLAYLQGSGKNR